MARGKKNSGFFIVFEGGDGAGKTTQMKRLVWWLKDNQIPVELTLEPGGTEIGEEIRALLLNPKHTQMSSKAELLLYAADRAQHVEEMVIPALNQGKVVICDRYTDSTLVYQGMCRKLGLAWTQKLNAYATSDLVPNLVILMDVPVTVGLNRLKGRRELDRLEAQKREFHEKVRKGYLKLAKKNPQRYAIIDATQSEEVIADQIASLVRKRLKRKSAWKHL